MTSQLQGSTSCRNGLSEGHGRTRSSPGDSDASCDTRKVRCQEYLGKGQNIKGCQIYTSIELGHRLFVPSPMVKGFSPALAALLFVAIASCSPASSGGDDSKGNSTTTIATTTTSSTSTAASASPTVPYASDDPNAILWTSDEDIVPEPVRGSLGAPMLGPHNVPIELQNADLLAPPTTDNGDM